MRRIRSITAALGLILGLSSLVGCTPPPRPDADAIAEIAAMADASGEALAEVTFRSIQPRSKALWPALIELERQPIVLPVGSAGS